MPDESIDDFLNWIHDKKNIALKYNVKSSNFVRDAILSIEFLSIDDKETFTLRCPSSKRENKNFLRIVRKSILELDEKNIIIYGLKDFLNFIPGNFTNISQIFDIQLLESMAHGTKHDDSCPNIDEYSKILKNIVKSINDTQTDFYHKILLPSVFAYSKMEYNGLPTSFGHPLYSYYDLNGTVSGRLTNNSFNDDRFVNPLNMSKVDRKIIQAPPGFELIIADYNAMEMRVLACIADEKNLIERFEEEEDVYISVGQRIFGLREIDSAKRQAVKDLCFLIIYGGTEFGFSKQQDCSVEEARMMIKRFYQMFPGIESWSLQTQIDIIEKGFVESIFGRRRYLDMEDGPAALRQGQNFTIQSPTNDIVINALLDLDSSVLSNSSVLMHIHDSLVVLSPIEKINGNVAIMKKIMRNPSKIKDFGINNLMLAPVFICAQAWE